MIHNVSIIDNFSMISDEVAGLKSSCERLVEVG
jgi:hypothetical protein